MKTLRLGSIVKEFNVAPDHIINFLSNKGFCIEKKLSTKLPEEAYLLLEEEFKADKLAKEKGDEIGRLLPQQSPLPHLNKNRTYERICFRCNHCNEKGDITVKDSDFLFKLNESIKVWLFELNFACKKCNEEINFHFEIQESSDAISNYIINFQGANVCDCPKGYNEEDDDPTENRTNERDPYENFHWGGLSGEEAYIGYWNTD